MDGGFEPVLHSTYGVRRFQVTLFSILLAGGSQSMVCGHTWKLVNASVGSTPNPLSQKLTVEPSNLKCTSPTCDSDAC